MNIDYEEWGFGGGVVKRYLVEDREYVWFL